MKTINILQAGLIFGALTATPALMASTFVSTDSYSFGANGETAGEFSVTGDAYNAYHANYNANAIVNGGFETFCVETGVNINLGNSYPYNYTVSQSTPGTHNTTTGAGLALTSGAAWLYEQFALGDLTTGNSDFYNYADTGSGNSRKTDAGLLQSALWAFQGGQSVSGWPSGTSGNPYYTAALNHFGTLTLADAASAGAYNVAILNLTYPNGTVAQNQLVLTNKPTTTPDSASTVLLLGVSLGGLFVAGLRRQVATVRS
jgi:hypothetical protein